jgi:hypothetical protein
MFEKWREVRRLNKEVKRIEGERDAARREAISLRQQLEARTNLLLERDFAFVDRFLTSQAKTYAISDEAKVKSAPDVTKTDVREAELTAFMSDKKDFLRECLLDAGCPPDQVNSRVERDFSANYEAYKTEFEFSYE